VTTERLPDMTRMACLQESSIHPEIERPAMREQIDARPRQCYHKRPKSQHEPWVHDNGYIFHRGNFMYNSQCKYTRGGAVFPGDSTPVLMIGADRSHFTPFTTLAAGQRYF
jgi:hypothetical protein